MQENTKTNDIIPSGSKKVIQPPANMAADIAAAEAAVVPKPKAPAAVEPAAMPSLPPLPTPPVNQPVEPVRSTPLPVFPTPEPLPTPPVPPAAVGPSASPQWEADPEHPVPVINVYSTYGMEYIIMFISLGIAAISWAVLLQGIVDVTVRGAIGSIGGIANSYSVASLIVSFPVFAVLFLRLSRIEADETSLVGDASRRRGMQITLVVSFIAIISKLATYIYSLLNTESISDEASSYFGAAASSSASSLQSGIGDFLDLLITLLIAGGIFGYYWYKLHRRSN